MKAESNNAGVYVVQVGKGFINIDDILILSKDISELHNESAFFYKEEAEDKAREFGGKLYEVVLAEREMD